jgi:uncharacterized protein (TIGR00730 family)
MSGCDQKTNQRTIQSVAVFCGSSSGNHPLYAEAARQLGAIIADHSMTLVYGGGSTGLMNQTAEGCIRKGGKVIGVIPTFFNMEAVGRSDLSEMILVSSMSQRKEKIIQTADAFIALPGGYGTLDELFEVLVCSQLSLHQKPAIILNTCDFYTPLLMQLERMQEEGFLYKIHRNMFSVCHHPQEIPEQLRRFAYRQDAEFLKQVKR